MATRLRFAGPEVRVGRGYDNDVVIDDPYVAARHLRVFRDEEGQLVAEDLGSVNGLYLDRDSRRRARILIDPERPLRVGYTLVRVRGPGYAMKGERVAAAQVHGMGLVLTVALAAAVLGITLMTLWLSETGEPRASRYLVPVLYTLSYRAAVAIDPQFKPAIIKPISADGKTKPIHYLGAGANGLTVLKKGTTDRVKEVLGVLNFIAAPLKKRRRHLEAFWKTIEHNKRFALSPSTTSNATARRWLMSAGDGFDDGVYATATDQRGGSNEGSVGG